MRRLLIRLYPARWRDRYGDEFEALLEARPLGPFDVADIVLGAIDARLRPHGRGAPSTYARGFTMSLRIGGIAAIAAGALWGFALVGSTGILGENDPRIEQAIFILGTFALLVALIGLSAFQARENPALIWAAFALPAIGAVVSLIGLSGGLLNDSDAPLIAGLSPWYVWMIGTMATIVGSALFAYATHRTGVLSRRGATLLAVGSVLAFPALVIGGTGFDALAAVVMILAIVGFSAGWIILGLAAVRTIGPAVDPYPA